MKYPLVYIEWCDAIDASLEWMTPKNGRDWGKNNDWIIKQVGFILKETNKYILIFSKHNPHEGDSGMINNLTKIPKTWIIKRKEIHL